MSNEQTIKLSSLGSLIKSVSGLFITPDNPNGITIKEMKVISCLLSVLSNNNTKVITKDIKIEVAEQLNQSLQVTINYITKLRQKNVISKDNKFHPLFYKDKIILETVYE